MKPARPATLSCCTLTTEEDVCANTKAHGAAATKFPESISSFGGDPEDPGHAERPRIGPPPSMPRTERAAHGSFVYHALNRSVGRMQMRSVERNPLSAGLVDRATAAVGQANYVDSIQRSNSQSNQSRPGFIPACSPGHCGRWMSHTLLPSSPGVPDRPEEREDEHAQGRGFGDGNQTQLHQHVGVIIIHKIGRGIIEVQHPRGRAGLLDNTPGGAKLRVGSQNAIKDARSVAYSLENAQ